MTEKKKSLVMRTSGGSTRAPRRAARTSILASALRLCAVLCVSACAGAGAAFQVAPAPCRTAGLEWDVPPRAAAWHRPRAARGGGHAQALRLRMGAGAEDSNAGGLRTMFSPPWACMAKCGACCYLAPQERDLRCVRPRCPAPACVLVQSTAKAARAAGAEAPSDACSGLSEQERETYVGMAGDDGWYCLCV